MARSGKVIKSHKYFLTVMISVIENILQFELPGSGKTRVLLWRTLNLIVFHNLQPNEIFLATFTEKAALQLKEGFQGLLSIASKYTHKPYDIAEMYVGTLHSLCQKLLSDRRFSEGMARSRRL